MYHTLLLSCDCMKTTFTENNQTINKFVWSLKSWISWKRWSGFGFVKATSYQMGSGNLNSTRILIEHKFTRVNVRNKVPQNPFNEYTLNTIKFHLQNFRPLSRTPRAKHVFGLAWTECPNDGGSLAWTWLTSCGYGFNLDEMFALMSDDPPMWHVT